MKKDKYTKTLAKNQVCEIFQTRDIGKNGLPKCIKLCMETPCWCPGGGGVLGYFLGGYVPPGAPNWHPVLKNNSPKIDTPF